MTLLLTNEDVERVLDMPGCLDVLRNTFLDYERGQAVNRPRSHTYTPVGDDQFYLFKSMDGSVPRYGVHGLRLSSDRLVEKTVNGVRRREKSPVGPGGTFLGLVLIFSLETNELLAIIQDGYLQRTRVGATSGLAAGALAREDAKIVGMLGTGWQAGAQLLALREVRDVTEVKVTSPNEGHRTTFASKMEQQLGIPVRAMEDPRKVIEGSDIVITATNSSEPVFDPNWVTTGQHVNSVQGRELDDGMLDKAELIAVRSRDTPSHRVMGDREPDEVKGSKTLTEHQAAKTVELGKILAGEAGRSNDASITLFGGGGMGGSAGLGIQFAAVGALVHKRAVEAGLGHDIPSDWFLETLRP